MTTKQLSNKANGAVLRQFLFPDLPSNVKVSPGMVERALERHLDVSVRSAGRTLILRKSGPAYFIEEVKPS